MRRAVFLDRDGTINVDVGYVGDPSELDVYPFAAAAIRALNAAGLLAVVVTNQSGVARGLYDEAAILRVHERLGAELAADGARLDAAYYCPHHPSIGVPPYRCECECRKPRPGMLERAAGEHDIDLARSFVVGDKYSDIALGHRAGARSILVKTGYGRSGWEYDRTSWPRQPEHVAETLEDAVAWILEQTGKEQP